MRKIRLAILLFLAISSNSWSQQYKTAIGLKGGYPSLGGINIKKILSSSTAAEFSIGGYVSGLAISGLFEIQKPLPEPNGLYWYLGVGPTVGSVNKSLLLSANGVLGIEYTFQDFPLNIALDTGPVIQLIGNKNLFSWGGGLAVRYAFK
ncbi:MAG: hypothetical protein FJY17_07090 [Bacteroidetes bacterium]|nr:hypothetical protein [Bacteroidota bacterium]